MWLPRVADLQTRYAFKVFGIAGDEGKLISQGDGGNLGIFCADGAACKLSLSANQSVLLCCCSAKDETTPTEIELKKRVSAACKCITALAWRQKGYARQDLSLCDGTGVEQAFRLRI